MNEILYENEKNEKKDTNIKDSIKLLPTLIKKDTPTYLKQFELLYPEFSKTFKSIHSDLSTNEFKFCTLLYLNLSSKEIADFLNLSHRTVQTKKNRLRKKINLENNTDMYEYIVQLEKNTKDKRGY